MLLPPEFFALRNNCFLSPLFRISISVLNQFTAPTAKKTELWSVTLTFEVNLDRENVEVRAHLFQKFTGGSVAEWLACWTQAQ